MAQVALIKFLFIILKENRIGEEVAAGAAESTKFAISQRRHARNHILIRKDDSNTII